VNINQLSYKAHTRAQIEADRQLPRDLVDGVAGGLS
jgi:hypothetical protein